MKLKKARNVITCILLGASASILYASKKETATQEELEKSWIKLKETFAEIDWEKSKKKFLKKLDEIEQDWSSLDVEEGAKVLKDKKKMITTTCDSIANEAKDVLPSLADISTTVEKKTTNFIDGILMEIKSESLSKKGKSRTQKS